MGQSSKFLCPGCGYEAWDGPGWLMTCRMEAVVCRTCKEVRGSVTHSAELGNFPPSADKSGAPLKCSVDPAHKVTAWSKKHPCPKCGKHMKESGEMLCVD